MSTLVSQTAFQSSANSIVAAYCLVIAIVLVYCWRAVRTLGHNHPLPQLPEHPDPYEVAYLYGGTSEASHVAVLSLWMRGYISENDRFVKCVESPPSLAVLSPLERQVFDCCAMGLDLDVSADEQQLDKAIELTCQEFRESLDAEQLLDSPSTQKAIRDIAVRGTRAIVGSGCISLVAVYLTDSNYPKIAPFLALIGIIWIYRFCRPPESHMSEIGKRYLHSLQQKFLPLQEQLQADRSIDVYVPSLLIALFGTRILKQTAFFRYMRLFSERPISPVVYVDSSDSY